MVNPDTSESDLDGAADADTDADAASGSILDLAAWLTGNRGTAASLTLTRDEVEALHHELQRLRQSNHRLRKQNRKVRKRMDRRAAEPPPDSAPEA